MAVGSAAVTAVAALARQRWAMQWWHQRSGGGGSGVRAAGVGSAVVAAALALARRPLRLAWRVRRQLGKTMAFVVAAA